MIDPRLKSVLDLPSTLVIQAAFKQANWNG